MKRRDFLTGSALAGIGAAAASELGRAQNQRRPIPVRQARSIIFFVYDGFSWEDLAVARHYAHRHLDRTLSLEKLLVLGTAGSMLTHSLTSIVTDSAAAATVWSTGRRTANGNIGVFPSGRHLTTVLELAKAQGRSTGLITTTRVTHATPAGFAAHILDRNREDEIALQYLELQPDVILGGGSNHFDADKRSDGRNLFSEFSAKGYSIARTVEQLDRVSSGRVLGTFTPSHLPYEIDRVHQGANGPSLAQITRKGLELLSGARRGFVAQVEAGRIDHANHNNDPATMLWDVMAADEALKLVLEFADQNPETLVLVASDHGTGGGAVYGVGTDYHRASSSFDRIASRRASYEFVLDQLGPSTHPAEVSEVVESYLGVELSPEEAAVVVDAIQGKPSIGNVAAYHQQPENSLAWVVASGTGYDEPDHLNIQYSAGQHTAGPVPIALYGAGTAEAQLGLVDITEVFGWMTRAIGVKHENPIMSEAEAASVLEGLSAATGTDG